MEQGATRCLIVVVDRRKIYVRRLVAYISDMDVLRNHCIILSVRR